MVIQIAGVGIVAALALWFKAAVASQFDDYVTQREWQERNKVIDTRFDKLEIYVQEGRVERMKFQADVIDRLARIEAKLQMMGPVKP